MEGNSVDNKKKIVKKKFKAGLNKIKISDGETRKKRKFRRKAGAIIYLGCIPHGFYEDQMTSYFSQFGKVLDARVARSAKTGRSKSFGFVEFQDEDVAKIAAETMNNYLMFNRIIKCKYIPPEERKGKFLRQIEANNYPRKLRRKEEAQKKLNSIEKLDQQTYLKKAQKKINAFKKYFEEQGIDFSLNLEISDSPKQGRSTPSKSNSRSNSSTSSQSQSDPNEQFGVLEIDESDSDIHFETPPQVKKIIKRSLNSPVKPAKKLRTGKTKSKMENLKLMEPVSTISKEKQEVKKEQKKKNSVNKSKGLSVKVPQVKTTQQKKKMIPQAADKNPGKKNEKSQKQGKIATAKGARKTRT